MSEDWHPPEGLLYDDDGFPLLDLDLEELAEMEALAEEALRAPWHRDHRYDDEDDDDENDDDGDG